ncbi:lipopolysaccharide biosynthesis protein [Mucilaginibacter gotjawali]|uniref:O-antigen/teichoic acid export membrane protein n=1 Tax=Mucilaginibacter gotjawali TaxID=1550579 RepID=A0A839S8B1_9SPHI|nr:MATE family efflux transporter [Mucilaginibacter gotjawali]MBB3054371.1 O-antigen/teichoic acid export membrane protein [Mucilaginibacter gotjawali]
MAEKENIVGEGRKKATIWNLFFLNIGFIITLINGVLIIPLYLHYMDGAVYGAWLATGNVLTWITIVDPGVAGVLLQRVSYALGEKNEKELGLAISSGILIAIVLFILSIIVGYGLSYFIGSIANIDMHYRSDIVKAFRIALWGTSFSLLADTFRNIILAWHKTKLHGILLYSCIVAANIVTVVLLVLKFGVYALAYSSLFLGLSILLFAITCTCILLKRNKIKLAFQFTYFKSFSKVFVFTFSSNLFETLAANIDLIIVSRYIGSKAVAVLDLSRRPLRIVSGLANNITISMLPSLPHLFGANEKEKIRIVIMRIWTILLWVAGFIICGFILFSANLTENWVGKQFWIGNSNNIILCTSFLLLSIGYNLSNITLSMGHIKSNSLISMARSIAYVVLLLVLSKVLGMTGVLLAFLIPTLILIAYYPKKVFRKANLSAQNLKELIHESLLTGIIVAGCILISYSFKYHLSWFGLIGFSALYSVVFLVLLFSLSKRFRGELNIAVGVFTVKAKAIVQLLLPSF